MADKRFPHTIFVRSGDDDSGLLIVGDGKDLATIDAEDGDTVAIYERVSLNIYRTSPTLHRQKERSQKS